MELFTTDKDFIKKIPEQPGVYRFYSPEADDLAGELLLYVGKALNLKKRIQSYFQRSHDLSPRISLMVKKIYRLEITVTENEVSALILENNLIKSLKPKYNIVFRDDKTYPLIRISKHAFPRIDKYRGTTNTASHFFGPYPNLEAIAQTLDMLQKLFKLRTCTDTFFNNRSRPCMLYEIKRCSAPCVALVTKNDYQKQVELALDFLEGRYSAIIDNLTQAMFQASDNLEFELAATIRDKIGLLKQISLSQIINNHKRPISTDLILIEATLEKVFIYLIIIRNGIYVGDNHFILDNVDNDPNQVFQVFLEGYYLKAQTTTKQIHMLFVLSPEFRNLFKTALGIQIIQKFSPELNQLYKMGQINLHKIMNNQKGHKDFIHAAQILAKKLGLDMVNRIECIDVSHNQGDNTVASLVVYENGVIDNSKYRKYNLASEVHGNDLLALKIVLNKRLTSLTIPFPEVLLVDGGLLQLRVAKNILIEHGLYGKIRPIAIFKGEKRNPLKDKVLLDNGLTFTLADEQILFKLLQSLRDEAHRFAITGHRKKQANKMTVSKLVEIPNIGVKKRRALITHFGSIREVAHASVADLQKIVGIGEVLANQIYLYFH